MSERVISFFLSFIIFILTGTPLISQDAVVKSTRQSSLEEFSKGDYEKAYNSFSELLTIYPKDPLYKYYSGVCLVKLSRDPEKALTMLNEARSGGSVARIVPSDAIYWQGRALQMTGKFNEAIECFNTFVQTSGKKAARDLRVSDYIEQCNRREGRVFNSEPVIAETVSEPKPEPELSAEIPMKVVSVEEEPVKSVPSEKYVPAKYDNILSEAMLLHVRADSLYRIADSLKQNLDKLNYKEKTELRSKITNTGNLAAAYQKQADEKYDQAQASMNATPFVPTIKDAKKMHPETDSFPAEIKKEPPVKSAAELAPVVPKDSLMTAPVTGRQTYSLFGISSKLANSSEKVKIDPIIPPGLIYRIQIAVFRNPVLLSYFKGISPVYGFRAAGTDKTNYYVGMFRRQTDAARALTTVRQKGFRDAFIVSLLNGKAVSSERAALLEKEWGKKTFSSSVQPDIKAPVDTIPPTLSFRVEVMRSAKPVKENMTEGMKKVAGGRGLDCETLADGTNVYLVGKFITYESAEEYAGLLVKNGYRNARVTAWLGRKEIPVDTARQLFESPE